MQHHMTCLLTSFAVVSLTLAAKAEPKLIISQDGKSDYCIHFDKEDKDPRFVAAIKDLGDFLHEITGATIPRIFVLLVKMDAIIAFAILGNG